MILKIGHFPVQWQDWLLICLIGLQRASSRRRSSINLHQDAVLIMHLTHKHLFGILSGGKASSYLFIHFVKLLSNFVQILDKSRHISDSWKSILLINT